MRRQFPNLSHKSFQHPLDKKALQTLEKVMFLDTAIRKFSEMFSEKQFRLLHISENIRLSSKQCPSIYNKVVEAAKILAVPKLPEVYLDSTYTINAYAFGMQSYTIVLCSGLVDMLSEDELLAIIGHELGHIKCNHMLYKTMAHYITNFGSEVINTFLPMGIGAVAITGIQLAMYHWSRMAEFSCDRAALLVVQDPQVVAMALAKLAGYSHKALQELNIEEVINQASEYETTDDKMEQTMKLFLTIKQTHPMPVVRVREIMDWSRSKEYDDILAGKYFSLTALENQVTCPECKAIALDDSRFCSKCGLRLPEKIDNPKQLEVIQVEKRICPKCKTVVSHQSKFCLKCGVRFPDYI